MIVRGLLRNVLVSVALASLLTGCSHPTKRTAADKADGAYGASSQGVGEGGSFTGSESERDLLAKRKIYFDYDQANLHDEDYPVIQAHAEFLKNNADRRIRLEGHTDEQGSREYNVGLGERRARTVAQALMSHGVSANQIVTVSFGKEKPDAYGHSEESHRLNRRSVIVYEEM